MGITVGVLVEVGVEVGKGVSLGRAVEVGFESGSVGETSICVPPQDVMETRNRINIANQDNLRIIYLLNRKNVISIGLDSLLTQLYPHPTLIRRQFQ